MVTPQNKTAWYEVVKNYLPAIALIGTMIWNVFSTWDSVKRNSEEIKDLNSRFEKFIEDQIKINDKEDTDIEEAKDWIKYQEGYQQALKDMKRDKQ
jgi:hypothetical protein